MKKKVMAHHFLSLTVCFILLICVFLPPPARAADVYVIGEETGDYGFPSPHSIRPLGFAYMRLSFIFDTLVWKDMNGFIPALAKSWNYEPDKLRYNFYLQQNATWHDGRKVTVDDVVFTFNYLKKYPLSWIDLGNIKEVEKVSDGQVAISLKKPDASFLNSVAGVVPVMPAHIWEGIEKPEAYREKNAVIGSGPYKLEEYNREKGIYRLSANKDYYLGPPSVSTLIFTAVGDAQLSLLGKEVNIAQVKGNSIPVLEKAGFTIFSGPHDMQTKIFFNHKKEPFNKVVFRQAVAHAIDRNKIVERALQGHGLPGNPGLVSPDSRWYNPNVEKYPFDLTKSEDLLKSLGYKKDGQFFTGSDGKPLKIKLLTIPELSREGELVREFLENAGLVVELQTLDRSVMEEKVKKWDYDMAITRHGAIGGDPGSLSMFMVGEVRPHLNTRYNHPGLVEALERQLREMDAAERKKWVDKVQEIYAAELPALTLYYPNMYFAHDGKVNWFFTQDALSYGVPTPFNKMALVQTVKADAARPSGTAGSPGKSPLIWIISTAAVAVIIIAVLRAKAGKRV